MKICQIFQGFLICSFLLAPLAQASFTDIASTNGNYVAITTLVDQGVIEGYSDGTFKPDQEVNRAEALKIILEGMNIAVEESSAGVVFSDVKSSDWFFNYVGTAVKLGIVKGYSDNTFLPGQNVNRAEAMKMLALAGGVTLDTSDSSPFESAFYDVATSDWYVHYAGYAKMQNIVPAQWDGLWHGEEALSRAELAEMVYRLQEVQENGHAFDEATNWLRSSFPNVNVSMKVPFGWGLKQEGVGAVFVLDSGNGQVSLLTPYENGGTLLMTRYPNWEGQSTEDLFAGIEAQSKWPVSETTVGGYDALLVEHDDGLFYREWYVSLPDGTLVNLVAMRGDGAYSNYLEWYFNAMIGSLEYSSTTSTGDSIEDIVASLREVVQVDGLGAQMKALLTDWELFETDTIGVGTGPVDYYYSPSANVTIKYERSFDVILDLREGKTSAF